MALGRNMGHALGRLSLCARLSVIVTVLALAICIAIALSTGERGAWWLAGAIALFTGLSAALNSLGASRYQANSADAAERNHAR